MSLYVKPISALLTRDTEMFSNMDPYVVFSIGSQKKKTRTHKEGGKKPKWDQVIVLRPTNTFMEVTVYDEDTFTDDTVGSTKIDLSKYINSQTEEKQYFSLTYKGKSAGKLYLSIRYQKDGSSSWGSSQQNTSLNAANNGNFSNTQNSWGNGQKKPSGQSQQATWGSNNAGSNWGSEPKPNTLYGQNQNSGWGTSQNKKNSGWGNQNDGWGQQNQGWGPQNNGWGNQGNQNQTNGWGSQQNNQNSGWGNQGNQGNNGWGNQGNNGWGNQGNQGNNGWGNQGNNGWGNQGNQSDESQQALKALGAMFNNQANKPQGQQGNENVMGILSGALQQGVQNPQKNSGNSGGWETGANSGWGPNNNGWGNQGNSNGW